MPLEMKNITPMVGNLAKICGNKNTDIQPINTKIKVLVFLNFPAYNDLKTIPRTVRQNKNAYIQYAKVVFNKLNTYGV